MENHRAEIVQELGDRQHPELGTISCPRCDKPRMEHLTNLTSLRSHTIITNQLVHGDKDGTKNDRYKLGIITLNRDLRPLAELTPNFQIRAWASTKRMLLHLKRKPNITKEITYKLEKDYQNKKNHDTQ